MPVRLGRLGDVVGHGGICSTTASFENDGDAVAFVEGECSCPVVVN